jgi:hypothetical protein
MDQMSTREDSFAHQLCTVVEAYFRLTLKMTRYQGSRHNAPIQRRAGATDDERQRFLRVRCNRLLGR